MKIRPWNGACQWRHTHKGPHGGGYLRKGHLPKLCKRCWALALGENPDDRYQVVALRGFEINPASMSGHGGKTLVPVQWYVQDRALNYRAVAVFQSANQKFDAIDAEKSALKLCAELNADERAWMAAGDTETQAA